MGTSKKYLSRLKKRLEQKNKRELARIERLGLRETLKTLASWYRDLLVVNYTSSEELVLNIDKIDKLKLASEVTDMSRVKQGLDAVLETKGFLGSNVNVKLAFEVMLVKLKEVC